MEQLLELLIQLKNEHPDLEVIPELAYDRSDFTTNYVLLKTEANLNFIKKSDFYLICSAVSVNIMELYNSLDFCEGFQSSRDTYIKISDLDVFKYPENNLKLTRLSRDGGILSQFYNKDYTHLFSLSYYFEPIDKEKEYTLPLFLREGFLNLDTFLFELGSLPTQFLCRSIFKNIIYTLGSSVFNSDTQVLYTNSDDYSFFTKKLDFLKSKNMLILGKTANSYNQDNNIDSLIDDVITIDRKYINNLIAIESNFKLINSLTEVQDINIVQGVRICSHLDLTASIKTVYNKSPKLSTKTYLDLPSNTPVAIIATDVIDYKIYSAVVYAKIENIIITTPTMYQSIVEECKSHFDTIILSEDINTVEGFVNTSAIPLDLILIDIKSNLGFYYYTRQVIESVKTETPNNVFLTPLSYIHNHQYYRRLCNQYSLYYSNIHIRSKGFPALAEMIKQEYSEQYNEIHTLLSRERY